MGDLDTLIAEAKARISALISKPKMTEKLLQKPPFRFLHDTVTAITIATGFGDGLYSPEELDSTSEGMKEKNAKMAYLEKIFTLVGICKGAPLEVKSLKVVQGLEPEHTNTFLIALAECASDPTLDNAAAVTRTLAGEFPVQNPIPRRQAIGAPAPRAEAKESNPPMQAQAKAAPAPPAMAEKPVAKNVDMGPLDMPAGSTERGKSRGGTRGGKPNQATADVGLSGPTIRLDGEIERCDGTEATTQQLLGELITRPKLTEKLLQRPPFKFIFDIVLEVIRVTGFGRGLYSDAETDKDNVNSREQKIEFLDKIISLVGRQLGTMVEAKSVKIIAGQEAQATNNFLQLLAVAAKHVPDSTDAVRAILDGSGDASAPSVVAAPEAVPAPSTRADAKMSSNTSPTEEVKSRAAAPPPAAKATPSQMMNEQVMRADPVMLTADDKSHQQQQQAAAVAPGEEEGGEDTGDVKRSTRPTTVRRRPPKIKEGATELTAKDTSAAPNQAKKATGIIVDGANNDDDIDEAIDDPNAINSRLADEFRAESKASENSSGVQSKLVQNIMSRQVEQEAAARTGKTIIEAAEETKGNNSDAANAPSGGIRLNRMRSSSKNDKSGGKTSDPAAGAAGSAGANIAQTFAEGDIDKMRNAIQSLVQQTGPLGTCLDFIQEDISLMNAELHKWEEECRRYEVEYEEAKRKTKEKLHPLRTELLDLEDQIAEQLAVIAASKANNVKLEEKIQSTLKMIATA